MDWLISRIRLWLGIELSDTVIRACFQSQVELISEQADLILALQTLGDEHRKKLEELHRFEESISTELANLRLILVTRPEPPKAIRARSWTEAQRLMQQEEINA